MNLKSIFIIAFTFSNFHVYTQNADTLLLKNYRPVSIYHIPVTDVKKARFPVIDVHSHDYAATDEEIRLWIRNMDKYGIEKTIILSYQTGYKFDSIYDKYAAYGDRFEVWCGFDYTGYNGPDWPSHALAELERCHKKGAGGVGELGDKGLGLVYSKPTPAYGMHLDDPRMRPLLQRCGELDMPINIHVAEPYWMYLPSDSTNDGLMNASAWKIDLKKEGILDHGQMIITLENAVKENPKTTFIACHFANCCYNLEILGKMLDQYPNLYADISARYAETATIPRYMAAFYKKYQDRLLYGTDMGYGDDMYETTFRILQTADEHFYRTEQFNYHWALNGFDLDDEILKKLYKDNAVKVLHLSENHKE
jgi:predicted TIM-barrel fold metal-dependent hydrolase